MNFPWFILTGFDALAFWKKQYLSCVFTVWIKSREYNILFQLGYPDYFNDKVGKCKDNLQEFQCRLQRIFTTKHVDAIS